MKFLAVLAMVAVAVNGLPGLIPRDGGNDWEKWNEKTVTITKYETKTETKTVTTEKPVYTTVTATKEVTKEVKVPVKEASYHPTSFEVILTP